MATRGNGADAEEAADAAGPALRSSPSPEHAYHLGGLNAPALSGLSLRLFNLASESTALGPLISGAVARRSNFDAVRVADRSGEAPLFAVPSPDVFSFSPAATGASAAALALAGPPLPPGAGPAARVKAAVDALEVGSSNRSNLNSSRPTSLDYHRAYLSKKTTPTAVAERLLAAAASPPASRYFSAVDRASVLEAAAASTGRYAQGSSLSALDGVPFAVKDAFVARPLLPTHGTALSGEEYLRAGSGGGGGDLGGKGEQDAARPEDSAPVAALRSLGAVCLGLTVMQECGIFANGHSPLSFPTPGNPHDLSRLSGGSSTGAAAAVASGLLPFAVGTDGGGSVRVPAALCGVFGLKPTQGRVPRGGGGGGGGGGASCSYTSVTTPGPIAGSAEDLLLAYAAIAETGGGGAGLPLLTLPRRLTPTTSRPLSGARVALWREWFDDAPAAPAAAALCRSAVDLVLREALGAVVLDDPSHVARHLAATLEPSRVAHAITISTETLAGERARLWDSAERRRRLNPDTRAAFVLALHRPAQDWLAAAKVRRAASRAWARVFEGCDFVVTPAAADVAPPAPAAGSAAATGGWLNAPLTGRLVKFAFAANFCGFPAVSVPVGTVVLGEGKESAPLPVGLQLMAAPWTGDAALLAAAAAIERALPSVAGREGVGADGRVAWRLGPVPLPRGCYFDPLLSSSAV